MSWSCNAHDTIGANVPVGFADRCPYCWIQELQVKLKTAEQMDGIAKAFHDEAVAERDLAQLHRHRAVTEALELGRKASRVEVLEAKLDQFVCSNCGKTHHIAPASAACTVTVVDIANANLEALQKRIGELEKQVEGLENQLLEAGEREGCDCPSCSGEN